MDLLVVGDVGILLLLVVLNLGVLFALNAMQRRPR